MNTAETVGKKVRIGRQGIFWSSPVRNIEQSRKERKAAATGCTKNTKTALSAMLPCGSPTGTRPHQIADPTPGNASVTRKPQLQ